MDIITLIISLISGAAGGNIASAAMPEKNLGAIANTVAGLIGGGLGEFILKALGVLASSGVAGQAGPAELDLSSILASIGIGGVSGGSLTAIITLIKNALENK